MGITLVVNVVFIGYNVGCKRGLHPALYPINKLESPFKRETGFTPRKWLRGCFTCGSLLLFALHVCLCNYLVCSL